MEVVCRLGICEEGRSELDRGLDLRFGKLPGARGRGEEGDRTRSQYLESSCQISRAETDGGRRLTGLPDRSLFWVTGCGRVTTSCVNESEFCFVFSAIALRTTSARTFSYERSERAESCCFNRPHPSCGYPAEAYHSLQTSVEEMAGRSGLGSADERGDRGAQSLAEGAPQPTGRGRKAAAAESEHAAAGRRPEVW